MDPNVIAEEKESEQLSQEPKEKQSLVDKKLKALWSDGRTYWQRLLLSACVMLALSFTFIFFGPLEMVAFSSKSLSYTYLDAAPVLFMAMGAVFLAVTPLISLLRGRIYNYLLCALFSFTLMGYLQAAVFNGNMGTLTGDGIDWSGYASTMLSNLLLWGTALCALLFVLYLRRKIFQKLVVFVSLLLVVMQIAPTVMIFAGTYKEAKVTDIADYSLSVKGMYQYAEKDNVFVFVLDRLDYDYIEMVLQEDPDFFAPLDGFTRYTNAISAYARTKPALNHILTAKEDMSYLAYGVDGEQYFKDSWSANGTNVLELLKQEGYDIGLYTNIGYLFSDGEYAKSLATNATDGQAELIPAVMLKKLMQLSAYRYTPLALKPFFWADTVFYNENVREKDETPAYSFADAVRLAGFGGAQVTEGTRGCLRFYHLMGSHAPYNLREDGSAVGEGETSNVTKQTMGCFRRLFEAFDRMKELGIYEDAAIIITADHGSAVDDTKAVQKETRIGLFYKPSGKAGTDLALSSAQVCTGNIPATVAKAAGLDHSALGRALDEIGEDEQVTRYYFKSICSSGSSNETSVCRYAVTGDAGNLSNWKLEEEIPVTGKFY